MDIYRLVSLLSPISNVFEQVAFYQSHRYFQDNKLFYPSQYGFLRRTLHSIGQNFAWYLCKKFIINSIY